MAALTIAELPFVERPIGELLHVDVDRDGPDHDFTGFGWARARAVWLEGDDGEAQRVDDALVIALHTADDGEALADDLELEFELEAPFAPVTVLASTFLDRWLPKLPQFSAIVLAICNRHRAVLRRPPAATVPVHYALGIVNAWHEPDPDDPDDLIILTAEDWCTLSS